jgi:putative tryptophan/tyrosine transport system substrate-binding protein
MKMKITVLTLCAMLFALCGPGQAQQTGKIFRIGYLSQRSGNETRDEAFRQGLRELGYVEGKNIIIELRGADGKLDRLPALASELVRLKVDIIVATSGAVTSAAKQATSAIPIVMTNDADPVANRFVASLSHPGGNITGLSNLAPELYGKRLELVKETLPKISRVGLLWNPSFPWQHWALKETQASARTLGLQIQSLEARSADDLDGIFETAIRDRIGALSVGQVPPMTTNRKRIVELAAKRRLPGIYADREWPEGGGLISYGPNITELHRRAATYVDKILKGTKPADLPVEQPMKFEFVINLKTAKQIGVTIPQSVLFRADKVIK